MPRNNQRGRNNNNPEGHNQYSKGWMDTAKERPMTTALGAAAAVGAGVFLWSRRGQISEQLNNISDQIGEWTENMNSREFETVGGDSNFRGSTGSGAGSAGSGASGDFGNSPSAGTGRATTSTSRSTGNKRRGATSGGTTGSGTMTGGSLDTSPSGRAET